MTLRCTEHDDAATFAVRVVPRAAKSFVEGLHEDALRVRLAAPPVEGAANNELVRLLARALDVSRSQVEIISGHTARTKIVRVSGVSCAAVARLSERRAGTM